MHWDRELVASTLRTFREKVMKPPGGGYPGHNTGRMLNLGLTLRSVFFFPQWKVVLRKNTGITGGLPVKFIH